MEQTTVQIPIEFRQLFNTYWRYIVYYGGRGSGKSQSVARALLLRGRQKKLRILCTREYQNSIADSVHKLLKDLILQYEFTDYEIGKDKIINTVTGTEFLFKGLHNNIIEIKSTEGVDLCWVEEAQSITEESLNILTPTIRKAGSQIIFTYNRVNELDPVHVKMVMNKSARTYVKKVNFDVLQKLGLFPEVLELEMAQDGEDPELYAHKWLGEPISQQEKSIISRVKILEAMDRVVEDDGQEEYGVDVARMGNDRTVFWKRKGLVTKETKTLTKTRTTEICDNLEQFMGFNKDPVVKIDDTGVGGGVTDEMMKRGYNVIAINFGGKATDSDKYPNWISEAWFYLESIIDQISIPYNSDLLMELSTRGWAQDTRGKRRVESKNEYKKKGFRSPDLADACIICYANPESGLLTVNDIFL